MCVCVRVCVCVCVSISTGFARTFALPAGRARGKRQRRRPETSVESVATLHYRNMYTCQYTVRLCLMPVIIPACGASLCPLAPAGSHIRRILDDTRRNLEELLT